MPLTRFPNGVSSFGVPVTGSGPDAVLTDGNVFWVDSNTGGNGNSGTDPNRALATIDFAIGLCTANNGDVIYVAANHAETITAAITADIEGITIIGLGNGDNRPQITGNFAGDTITVTADNVTIKNLYFNEATAVATAGINLAGAFGKVENCRFDLGANDGECITVTATGDQSVIIGNEFVITANGPTAAIRIEAAGTDGLQILHNFFDGDSGANQWDNAAVYSTVAHTDCLLYGNVFYSCQGIEFTTTATGIIANNYGGTPYVTGSAEYIATASGGEVKVVSADTGQAGTGSGSSVESTTGEIFYVGSTVSGAADTNDGSSPTTPFATLDAAIGATTANRGDIIVCMPGHNEDVLTQIDADVAGIRIIGLGGGGARPTFRNSFAAGTAATLRIDADDIEISNILFTPGDTANTVGNIEIVAGADDVYIHDCVISQGANDLQGITFLGATTDVRIQNNAFRVTADGPDEAIVSVTGVQTGLFIMDNIFDGNTTANSWDDGAISSNQVDVGVFVLNNTFLSVAASINSIIFSSTTATGVVAKNTIAGNTAGSGINAVNLTVYDNLLTDSTDNALLGASIPTTGKYVFVDSGSGSDSSDGLSPANALATIDAAFGAGFATANTGSVVYVMPGHTETLAAVITMDVAGVRLVGLGTGTNRPQITVNGLIDGITVTAADCTIENLYFNESTAAATSNINVNAANVTIRDCHFDLGATDLESITWEGGANLSVINNRAITTANGPDAFLEIEGTNDGLIFKGNFLSGGSAANAWDAAAVNSVVAHTNASIEGNTFLYGTSYIVATSVSTFIGVNYYGIGAVSTTPAPQTWYTDLGTTIRDGKSPDTPTTLNDAMVTKATAGDTVYALAGSTTTLAAVQALSVAGVRLVGLGSGTSRPQITANAVDDGLNITGANTVIENFYFNEATAAATSNINVAAADVTIKDCHFDLGANDLECITWASGNRLNVIGNEFEVTANGPDTALEIEGTTDGLFVSGNTFNGMNATNQWDAAAINSVVAHTNALISDNTFLYGAAFIVATSVSTTVRNNKYGVGNAPTATTPLTIYVDNGATIRDGLSPETPTTLADAVDTLVRAGVGDRIKMLPGTYTLAATLTMDTAGVVLEPMIDNGTFNVTITTASDVDLVTLTGANIEIRGIRFLGNAAQVTTPVLISLATGDFCHIHKCFFDCANVATLQAITVAAGSTDHLINNNRFTGQVTAVSQILDLGARTHVVDNTFSLLNTAPSAWTNVGGAADLHQVFARNTIQGDGGARTGMIVPLSASAEEFIVSDNRFSGTSSATPFGQNANWPTQFIENYVASGAGGVLIDPVA